MVIIGGLAAIALLALIGIFLVLRSESGSAKPAASQAPKVLATAPAVPAIAPAVPSTVPAAPSSGLNGSAPLASGDDWTPVLANPELRARLRGQLRELKYELYYLHQSSREIEQRAALLAGIMARMQELTADTATYKQPVEAVPQRARPTRSN